MVSPIRLTAGLAAVALTSWIGGAPARAEAPAAKGKAKGKPAASVANTPEFKMAVWRTIDGSGRQIDSCTSRYSALYPDRTGSVSLWFDLAKDGRVKASKVTTSLGGQDNLTSCLRDVVRAWRFPKIGENKVSSSVNVNVAKGAKFKMLKPGEKPPKKQKAAGKKRDGFLRFSPGLPSGK